MTTRERDDDAARVLVLRTAGTNCDEETAHAFELAGAAVESLHVGVFLRRKRELREFDILVLPGGFSYGDDLGAGTVLANRLGTRLSDDLGEFVASGKPVLGICNGFQVLVRLGILPGWDDDGKAASLITNVSGRFEDRWVHLRVDPGSSPFLDFVPREAPAQERVIRLPVAHKEGRFVLRDPGRVARLREEGQIVLTYCRPGSPEDATGHYPSNPNGSVADVAGITNRRGNVLGLMPHPERFVHRLHDPLWTRRFAREARQGDVGLRRGGDGYPIFESAVRFAERQRRGEPPAC